MQRVGLLMMLVICLAPSSAMARSNGSITSQDLANGGCGSGGQCHGDPSTLVLVEVTGPLYLLTGETAVFTARVIDAQADLPCTAVDQGNCQKGSGLLAAVLMGGGTMDSLEANTQLQLPEGEVTHVENDPPPAAPTNWGDWEYDFEITAPNVETTLEIATLMNAFDGSGNNNGDYWNRLDFDVKVVPEPGAVVGLAAGALWLGILAGRRRPRRPEASSIREHP